MRTARQAAAASLTPALRGALVAVLAGVLLLAVPVAARTGMGLGTAGDIAATLLAIAILTTVQLAVVLPLTLRLRWPRATGMVLLVAPVFALTVVLSVLLPWPFTTAYVIALLAVCAWLGGSATAVLVAWRKHARPNARTAIGAAAAVTLALVSGAWLAHDGLGPDAPPAPRLTTAFEAISHAAASARSTRAAAAFHEGEAVSADAAGDAAGDAADVLFDVRHIVYGSGTPQRRGDYAAGGDIASRTVDLRPLIRGFGGWKAWAHQRYWGFGLGETPLNGQAWLPVGEGPVPVVLVVHGQHATGSNAETGYRYLGELLAGHGFAVVAIDQNFLSGPWIAADEGEMAARSSLITEHLALLNEWNDDATSPFHGRLDLQRLVLVGHSRGGEAVTKAARFRGVIGTPHDPDVGLAFPFQPRGVIALAPTDGMYNPTVLPGAVRDISYLVLHGSQDSDVDGFLGNGAYQRIRVREGSGHFKAAVYIAGANHVQFNQVLGSDDLPNPLSWLLHRRALLPPGEQQHITGLLVAAFLEAVINGHDDFRELFRRPPGTGDVSPPPRYVTRFDDDGTHLFDTFEEDTNRATTTAPGGRHAAADLTVWREEVMRLRDRYASPQHNRAVQLGWRDGRGAFEVHVPADAIRHATATGASLVLSLANVSTRMTADLTVELVAADGEVAAIPLSRFGGLAPAFGDRLWKSVLLERFMVRGPEQVLQSYEIPVHEFRAANPRFNPATLQVVRLRFDRTPAGEILLDDIGFRRRLAE
ncbi:MAG TPA: hypothetical protein VK929_15935 [Longimicrobiales bacterium]|nr:hypothetical protein [Longimicrobiales bacterium]